MTGEYISLDIPEGILPDFHAWVRKMTASKRELLKLNINGEEELVDELTRQTMEYLKLLCDTTDGVIALQATKKGRLNESA